MSLKFWHAFFDIRNPTNLSCTETLHTESDAGPGPSQGKDQRRAQKVSVAARALPPPVGRARGRRGSRARPEGGDPDEAFPKITLSS